MLEQLPPLDSRPARLRKGGCRRELLITLIGICRDLERMQATAEAREACRQVEGQLQSCLEGPAAGKAAARRR